MKEYPIGVVVGRFQVHDLHEAHKHLINQVVLNHKRSIIFLGVPKLVGTKKNPLDFDTRKRMIQSEFPESIILSIPDQKDDSLWVKELDRRIREIFPIGEVLLYGGRDSFIPFYIEGGGIFDTKELEQTTYVSGTEVRKIVSDTVKNSPDFRAGIIYNAYNQHNRIYPYVNTVIFNESKDSILLSRNPQEDTWRFIGGFSLPSDSSYEESCIRKIHKDAGNDLTIDDISYLGSAKVDDWRYKSEEDKIISMLFECKISGTPSPSADISELKWFNIGKISKWMKSGDIVGPVSYDHVPLFKLMMKHYNTSG